MQTFSTISVPKTKRSSSPFFSRRKCSPFFKPLIQPRLSVGTIDDPYEREADDIANKITGSANTGTMHARQSASNSGDSMIAPPLVQDAIHSGGQPLDTATRNFMEPKLGYDLGDVQVHNDPIAHQSSKQMNALAYAYGNHIFFGAGQYQPSIKSGKYLLAHELVHVTQQSNTIRPYRPTPAMDKTKDKRFSFNFGRSDTPPALVEDSFDPATDLETKPWIEQINIALEFQMTDVNGFDTWVGEAEVKYYNNKVKLKDFKFSITAGSEDLGMSSAGDFKVKRIEGIGYNSGKYSGRVDKAKREGPKKRYSKDLSANMSYAVFYNGGEALHGGPLDFSSHGCVHVDMTNIQTVNYHSVIGHTNVKVQYP